jgi:hypothetical protein
LRRSVAALSKSLDSEELSALVRIKLGGAVSTAVEFCFLPIA